MSLRLAAERAVARRELWLEESDGSMSAACTPIKRAMAQTEIVRARTLSEISEATKRAGSVRAVAQFEKRAGARKIRK